MWSSKLGVVSVNGFSPTMARTEEAKGLLELKEAHPFGATTGREQEHWDLCIAVNRTEETAAQINEVITRVERFGLQTHSYLSVQGDEIYLLIRATAEKLQTFAEANDWRLECDPAGLEAAAREMPERFPDAKIGAINIPHEPAVVRFRPYEHIYLPYRSDPRFADVWVKKEIEGLPEPSPFGHMDRAKLVRMILEQPVISGGCGLNVSKLKNCGFSIFPLHNEKARDALHRKWLIGWRALVGWIQPYYEMKEYLGERVTLYFLLLGTHCRWLFFLGVVGTFVEAIVFKESNTEARVVAYFAIVVAFWSSFFTEFWKRRERFMSMIFGTSTFEASEPDSLQFLSVAERRRSAVHGRMVFYYPTAKRLHHMAISNAVMVLCLAAILACNVALFWFKIWMRHSSYELLQANYSYIFNIAISVEISVISVVYTSIADGLTQAENHRTETEHRDSLIFKLFFVQFINSYASMYYTAFAMKRFEGECDGYLRCMDDLCYLVATILVERLAFTFIYDNLIPRIMAWKRFREETAGADVSKFSPAEAQYILDPYDERMEMINRFMDQVIMFGYMVLFVTAFPMGPLIGFFSNVYQINQFGRAMLFHKQRNPPRTAQDIGTFQGCFENLGRAAVVTNSALIFFTMGDTYFGSSVKASVLVWSFFLLIGTVFFLMDIVGMIIPDSPEEVDLQLERQEFLTSKLIEQTPDEESKAVDPSLVLQMNQEAKELMNAGFILTVL